MNDATTKNMVPSMFKPEESAEFFRNMLKHSAMHLNFTRCSKASKTSELIRF